MPVDADGADHLVVLKHWHGEQGSNSAKIDRRNPHRIARGIGRVRGSVFDLDNPLCCDDAAEVGIRAWMNELVQPRFDVGRRRAVHGNGTEAIAFAEVHRAEFGLADARGILQHGLEHRLQFAGRRTDDTQHVRRRRLLLQRLAQFVEQPRVLDGDDGLGGEVLHQLDLLVGERPHLLAIDADDANELVVLEHGDHEERAGPG